MATEKFCLKWNDFESNISVAFRDIRDEKDFFDVTLACDDDQIQAHKVILSACSPFFRNVLKRNPHQHPLLYLKGVKYTDLQSVLNFMYHGEVNVAQDELNSFLAVAEELRVKGLTQNNGSQSAKATHSAPKSPPPSKVNARPADRDTAPPPKRPRPSPAPQLPPPPSATQDDDDIQEVVPVKSEPRDTSSAVIANASDLYPATSNQQPLALAEEEDYGQDESYDDYGQYDQGYEGQMIDPNLSGGADGNKGQFLHPSELLSYVVDNPDTMDKNKFMCQICGKTSNRRVHIRDHVENVHYPDRFVYKCELCMVQFKSKVSLKNHLAKKHKQPTF